MSLALVLLSAGLSLLAGLLGAVLDVKRGARAFTLLSSAAGLSGLAGACLVLSGGPARVATAGGALELDALGGLFLVPISVVSALASVFGLAYWQDHGGTGPGRRLRLFYGLAVAGLVGVVLARHAFVFLIAWEVMALSAFFLVATEEDRAEARRAAWIYLACTHTATLALSGVFALMRASTGSFRLAELPAGLAATTAGTVLFWLALAGFGLKAGLWPLHVWLPPAHAAAPSHVSALLSGVVIKIGIYGLVRLLSWVPDPPPWWGGALLVLGTASALLGVLAALGQHDLKRLLAYHSVENVGIIVLGLGLGTLGRSRGEAGWVLLGLSGGLLHVVNHGLFKPLLFLSAGNVVRATGTREIDRLGGLGARMPRTALAFAAGAAAICGLPPLNGFVSEWLVYLGLASAAVGERVPDAALSALAAAALALVGGLAVACFVKAFGAVFLGSARGRDGEGSSDGSRLLTLPMGGLALLCALIGLSPRFLAAPLGRVVRSAAPGTVPEIGSAAPLGTLTLVAWAAAACLLAGAGAALALRRRGASRPGPTWDCGYAEPTARMQYTSSSFAGTLVGIFQAVLRPRRHARRPAADEPVTGRWLFPEAARFESHVPDTVFEALVSPVVGLADRVAERARLVRTGRAQTYVLYVFVTLLLLLLFAV